MTVRSEKEYFSQEPWDPNIRLRDFPCPIICFGMKSLTFQIMDIFYGVPSIEETSFCSIML